MPEVVAERHDPKRTGWYGESENHRLAGTDPNYVYQRFSLDPTHPQYHGNYTRAHEIGDESIGYTTVKPWEIVHRGDKDTNAADVRKRADEGKDLDTTVQRGRLILMRLPKAEWEKYAERDRRTDVRRTKMLTAARKGYGPGAQFYEGAEVGTAEDGSSDATLEDLLTRAKGK